MSGIRENQMDKNWENTRNSCRDHRFMEVGAQTGIGCKAASR